MNLTLHPVKRATKASNRFCGPACLSILTGLDTRETARLLRHVSGKPCIKGIARHHMQMALARLGFGLSLWGATPLYSGRKALTLIRWLKESRTTRSTDTFLVIAGCHYSVVQGRRYACGIVGKIVPFSGIPHRKCRMDAVYRVTRVAARVVKSAVPPLPPRAKTDPAQTEAKKLATHWGIELEAVGMLDRLDPDDDGVFVYPPDDLYDDTGCGTGDPLEGNHGCYSWSEVLEAINVYVDALKARDLKAAASECPLGAPSEPVTS